MIPSMRRAVLALVICGTSVNPTRGVQAQSGAGVAPPVPFEDVGACPFEGCVYREWTAKRAIVIRTDRRPDAPVGFRLKAGEKVTAVTGAVVTVKPGRVQFREPSTLRASNGNIHIRPGQTLYLLTYQGEGFTKPWFNGRLYRDVDTVEFLNGVCDRDPNRCAGTLIEKSQTEWWIQIRTQSRKVGWTNEPRQFDGKDAFG